MGEQAPIIAGVHAYAFIALSFFIPISGAVHHVKDVALDLPLVDQATYRALVDAGNNIEFYLDPQIDDEDTSDISTALLGTYDKTKKKNRKLRAKIRHAIDILDDDTREATSSMLGSAFAAGAGMFHHHTCA